jgi:uncharacterized phage protein gp47/JayE
MTDTWIEKDEKTVHDDIIAIGKQETGLTNFKSVGVLRGFMEVIAGVVNFIYRTAINPIYSNASLDGATGIFLSFWGLMLGVVRKHESKTTGQFTGTAHGNGSIESGTWVVIEGTEIHYKVTEKVSFQSGSTFAIPVIAEYPGASYNIGPDTPIRLTRVVMGLDTVSVGTEWIVIPGQDEEGDEPYRDRIKSRWKSQMLGDTKEVYRYYAEAVDGVEAVKIIRAPRGPGSTDVIVAAVNGIPGEELLNAVSDNLYDHELLGFDVQIKAPVVQAITVQIEYSGDVDEAVVLLMAESYIHSIGIGGRFAKSDLYAVYEPLNLKAIEIISPNRDVQANPMNIISATVSVTKAAV